VGAEAETEGGEEAVTESPISLGRTVHLALLPWWACFGFFPLYVTLRGEGLAASTGDDGTASVTAAFAIVIGLVAVFVWWRLLAKIDRWQREWRSVGWGYPVVWAVMVPYIALIGLALLVPAFRRLITPKARARAA
jgi:hypothetical protein